MKGRLKNKFKKGAASFYIVAFSTLILVIIATSFAAIIISEITRTTNDDLAQSAWDSALAGVEDAKVAIYNYQNCIKDGAEYPDELSAGNDITCQDVVYWMNHSDCDTVARILGRIPKTQEEGGEVMIQESNGSNNMMQAYTCVKLGNKPKDYRSTLSSSNRMKLVKVKLDGVSADEIDSVVVSWLLDSASVDYSFTNFNNGVGVRFNNITSMRPAAPPTLAVQLIQTGPTFSFNSFDMSQGNTTNRGTVYLVPTDNTSDASKVDDSKNYIGAYNTTTNENLVEANAFVKANDKVSKTRPYAVFCDPEGGSTFACEARLKLPKPVGGGPRNDDTFMFAVSIPYGTPTTDFTMKFLCAEGAECATTTTVDDEGVATDTPTNQANLDAVQIMVDSTGRANDLYKRVEVRLEPGDSNYPYPLYAIQLLGNDSGSLMKKNLAVKCEWNFPNKGC